MNVKINEVRCYNRVLSTEEIKENFRKRAITNSEGLTYFETRQKTNAPQIAGSEERQ